jgi:hypothetical protein
MTLIVITIKVSLMTSDRLGQITCLSSVYVSRKNLTGVVIISESAFIWRISMLIVPNSRRSVKSVLTKQEHVLK